MYNAIVIFTEYINEIQILVLIGTSTVIYILIYGKLKRVA
jgi:hypothetical protein